MIYATTEVQGRKFLCVVTSTRGTTELSPVEANIIRDLPGIGDEWIECVWDYTNPELIAILEGMEDMEPGEKAQKVLDYCVEMGFLGTTEDDDEYEY